ncbi:MAG: aldehyde dehydrogenase [Planctomycetota bacterium]
MAAKKQARKQAAQPAKPAVQTAKRAAKPAADRKLPFGGKWQYAPSREATDYVAIAPKQGLFVGGAFVAPASKRWLATVNPATEALLGEVAHADECDVDKAVRAAQQALPAWRALSGEDRGRYLYRIARLLLERAREFAVLETLDNGKPITETRDVDVPLAAQHFFYHAGWADKLELLFPGARPEPLGVVGQVIPWNFPLLMAAWKIAPALAAGNTVVLKPAETSPLSALRLCELLQQAELPPGVVNVVTGDGATGAALVRHPGLAKVAFTGSTEVGKEIQRTLAGSGKDLTLELGGKAAHLVFEDAALDQAVEGVVRGIFFNQGHVCCAGSRLLVQESVHDRFVRKLLARIERIRVGDPLDKNTDMGAIHSRAQLAKIEELCAVGAAGGATMHRSACALPKKGYWCAPTVFTGVTMSQRIAREEIFGPVLAVSTFRTPDEAVQKANDTAYGLSAGIWTDKGARILWLAERMRAGVVWNNTFNRFDPAAPFGGMKESGFGREGGRQGLRAYVRVPGGLTAG